MARIQPASKPPHPEDLGPRTYAHTRYYTSDGMQVPGATTIVGQLDKPQLVKWANRLGLEGKDSSKYRDESALIGTLAHHIVESELKGEPPDFSDFTPNQAKRAQHSLRSFHDWRKVHTLRPILVEHALVSDEHRYGGTIDCLGHLDGVPTLLDFKTSAGVYENHKLQAAAYWHLLYERGFEVRGARILRIPRTAMGNLEEHVITGPQIIRLWRVFEHLCRVYWLRRELKEEEAN